MGLFADVYDGAEVENRLETSTVDRCESDETMQRVGELATEVAPPGPHPQAGTRRKVTTRKRVPGADWTMD